MQASALLHNRLSVLLETQFLTAKLDNGTHLWDTPLLGSNSSWNYLRDVQDTSRLFNACT